MRKAHFPAVSSALAEPISAMGMAKRVRWRGSSTHRSSEPTKIFAGKPSTVPELGNGLDPKTDVGPVINNSQLKRIDALVQEGRKESHDVLTGGEIASDGDLAKGNFYKPTLFTNVKSNDMVAQEEIFGPVTALIPVDSVDEAIEVNNNTKYGLSSSIYTQDVN